MIEWMPTDEQAEAISAASGFPNHSDPIVRWNIKTAVGWAARLGIVVPVPPKPECSICEDTGNYECSDGQCEVNHPCFCRHGDDFLKRYPESARFDLHREKRKS